MTLLRTPAVEPAPAAPEAPLPTPAPRPEPPAVAEDDAACESCLDRRQLLARAGAAGLGVAAVGLLAACGGSSGADDDDDEPRSGAPAAAAGTGTLAKVADIPVGGAVKAKDSNGTPIIVSQPQAGTIVALTAICPHKGCEVKPDGKDLLCPCHASIFTLTGGNVSGPAKTPLTPVDVHVADGVVVLGRA